MDKMTKTDILRKLFTEHNLIFDSSNPTSKDNDLFKHKHYTIITRSGIEKIQKSANIDIAYSVVYASDTTFVVKAKANRFDKDGKLIDSIETFGSASAQTSSNAYYPEMAEKRAMSRSVLKLAGMYEYGVFGQDEADEFEKAAQTRGTSGAQFKGS